MLTLLGKFVLLFILCCLSFSIWKMAFYVIAKQLIGKTADRTALNWILHVLVKNGAKINGEDCFTMAVAGALSAICI
ncbi:hypothetical protein P9D34_21510 [Bacillus swezeyi]|uniref:Uncharacterized protein n=1 Tax=Bacillus swezeyi TaxID=1925020 RepID=A0A1R1RM30_9BACI|nr:hypothetical protein [Bacillus swezeyi]MEC1262956.1 hypothetical protein [Bacillus swezeyi]MED2930013.1 hypothetical protein [Bacillus swezeyi]MED2944925.1 hypothetical protein [Bacillus swezeyi]MED2963096.1 hypothetical protein [Bacillus swezeyi]MED2976197.1 hypothetical protein [Bacillus swezeyi]